MGPTGAAADAALDETVGGAREIAGAAGRVVADAALLDVPAVGLDEDAAGADVNVLACLELELHAVANTASPTRAVARKQLRDDVSTGLLKIAW